MRRLDLARATSGHYAFTHDIVGEVVLRLVRHGADNCTPLWHGTSPAPTTTMHNGRILAHFERAGLAEEAVVHCQRAVNDPLDFFA